MAIGTYTPNQYLGDDITTVFPYTFKIFEETDLEVIKREIATGIETTLTYTTHYTVSGVVSGEGSPDTGGNCTLLTALPTGYQLTLRRKVPYTQTMDLTPGDALPADVLDRAVDRAVAMIQQAIEILNRALIRGANETTQLVIPTLVALGYLRVNAAGTALEFSDEVVTTVGTYTGTITYGTYASRAATPGQGDIHFCTDTDQILVCRVAGIWSDAAKFSRLILTPVALTAAARVETNAALGNNFTLTADQNFTLANPTNPSDGQKIVWRIKQDGTGSRVITFDTKFRAGVDGLPVLSTGIGKIDFIGAQYNLADDKWDIIAFDEGH